MARTKRLSKEELATIHADDSWRDRLLQISIYVHILEACILREGYRIPDDLNDAIKLSDHGREIQQALITRHDVSPKDARVLCLLEFDHVKLLVDVDTFDIEALHNSIHRQILAGDFLFPFTYGRELYDRAAQLFADETWILDYEDTKRLLDGTSTGVFQLRDITVGPYGLLKSAESRWQGPDKLIPLFHCAEITCDIIHRCRLSSDPNATINQGRAKIRQVLDQISERPSDWTGFISEIADSNDRRFNDLSNAPTIYLIGDTLSEAELESLLAALMDHTKGALRSRVRDLGVTGAAAEAVSNIGRAKLMQLALLSADAEIVRELDHLVLNETIRVPPGEVRRPVVNEGYSVGVHSLRPELGPRGVRFISASTHIGQLRLRRSIDRLYVLEKQSEVAELEFQLRDVDAPTLASQLAEFIRTRTPEEVLRRLVLARRSNVITICEELSLIDNEYPTDDDLIQTILWKLGFGLDPRENVHCRFWKHHADMKNLTQTAAVSAIVDQEAVRSLASNYFVSVEEVLGDSLAYSTWALTSDQLKGARPFTYREDVDRDEAFIRLNEAESNRDSGPEQITFGARNELYPLCRGYGILATLLESLQEHAEELRRPPDEVPELARYSDLRKFPFQHMAVFLDLVEEARRRIIQVLKDLSTGLVRADVSDVRNEWLHYRRSTADVGRLVDCLATMERTVETLEREGLARVLFRRVREDADSWGRRVHVLEDGRGREIAIARPSQYSTVGMPNLRSPQFLLTSAIIAEPNEMLRFRSSVSSDYASLWDDFPKRRRARGLDVDGASGGEPSSSRGGSAAALPE